LIQQTSFTFLKTTYLNEEVNCTGPSPSVSVPWSNPSDAFSAIRPEFCCKEFLRKYRVLAEKYFSMFVTTKVA
jgi:hypothetical protein